MDDAASDWSAHGLIAQQLLTTVEQGGTSGYMGGGVCVLYPGVRGNRDLSLIEPVLYVCLLRSSPIKADALSIAARCRSVARSRAAEALHAEITLCGRCIEACPYMQRYLGEA